jgi:hypothetical protein
LEKMGCGGWGGEERRVRATLFVFSLPFFFFPFESDPTMSFIRFEEGAEARSVRAASASACARQQDRTQGAVEHRVGRFRIDFEMTAMQRGIVERLEGFYTDEVVEGVLRPVLEQHEGWPSIRIIDWMLTNFAKSRRVVCTKLTTGEPVNVFMAYKTQLAFFRRRNFDAFRRRLRVSIDAPGGEMHSTIAQLNFYAWAHQTGILAWCRKHADEIEKDMNDVAVRKKARPPGQRRRTELSAAPRSKVAIYRID